MEKTDTYLENTKGTTGYKIGDISIIKDMVALLIGKMENLFSVII